MKSNQNQSTSSISISSYAGGGPDTLLPFIGTPCLSYRGTSNEWSKGADGRGNGVLKVVTFDDVGVLVIETRIRECFHYILMNLYDPALQSTLDIWKGKRGFVAVMETQGEVSAGICMLSKKSIRTIQRVRDKARRKYDPKAFHSFTQAVLERRAMDMIAQKQLEAEGSENMEHRVVEVQVLANAKVRGVRDLSMHYEADSSSMSLVENARTTSQSTETQSAAPFGTVRRARDFAEFSSAAASLKPEAPVLVATIDLNRFLDVSRANGVFGFGHFRAGDRVVLSFRLQSGAAQIYWLADSADPSVWALIDDMKRVGEAGFLLGGEEQSVFIPWKLMPQENLIGAIRAECLAYPGDRSDAVRSLAQSGFVEKNATTDISGVELAYVHVSVLSMEPTEGGVRMLQTMSSSQSMQPRQGSAADHVRTAETLH